MKCILKLKNLGKIEYFCLVNLPESLSAEVISEFFKKFGHVKIRFHFNEDISEDYKNQLDGLIDEIVESEIPNRIVEYDGQDE
uniref:RRM domain-containing protein n=1 Tax=Panagrolaimus sp. PS1159 TaxID=55785 RepID=A0AC35GUX7_9BILA